MFDLPYLYSPLYLAQAALTIWMLVDAHRRGVEYYWFWIIIGFQPIGAWAYFFLYKSRDLVGRDFSGAGSNWLGNLFTRRASLEELRFRVQQAPTMAAQLELAQRLVETHEYAEAVPYLQTVLKREPDHRTALFTLAECHRQLDAPAEAVPLLQKLIYVQSNWRNDLAWCALIETHQQAGNHAEAVTQARKLSQIAPSLEHKCLLARCLVEAGNPAEARQVVENSLDEYRFSQNPSRNDRRWVGKARKLLKEIP